MAAAKDSARELVIELKYVPRPQQALVHATRTRFATVTAHRRWGKTELALAEMLDVALRKGPAAFCGYFAPYRQQAKGVAWNRLKDLCRPIPGTQFMEVELKVVLPTGGVLQLFGANDGADHARGMGFDSVVLDEFSLMGDGVWTEVLRPALADRQGEALFIATPRGHCSLYRLIQRTQNDPQWTHFSFPASQSGVLPDSELAAARASMPEDAYLREFECSFDAAPEGSIYGKLLGQLRAAGRVLSVPWLDGAETFAALDLGIADATAVIVAQRSRELRVLWAREYVGTALVGVGRTLLDLGVRHLYLPHDAEVRELTTARSRRQSLEGLGFSTEVVPRVSVEEGIAAGAALLRHSVIDPKHAAPLLESLENYRREARDDGGHSAPVHDRYSHLADAWRYLALGLSADATGNIYADESGSIYRRQETLRTVLSDGSVKTFTFTPRR